MLSIRGTNFHACSASGKNVNIFTCTIHAQHTRNKFYRTLSIRGTNFIACWAYWEPISSHAEHARKCLKVEYLGRIEYYFQKSSVTGSWDHKASVSAKKVKKKISCLCTFNPSSPSHYGSVWLLPVISLLLIKTVSPARACLSIWLGRFRESQKKDYRGLLSISFLDVPWPRLYLRGWAWAWWFWPHPPDGLGIVVAPQPWLLQR